MTKAMKKTEATKEIEVFTKTEQMGVADNLTSADVQLPSLMLMQANSTIAKDRTNDIKSGDFVHSISNDVWGSIDEPLLLTVCDMFTTLIVTEVEGNNWVSTQPWKAEFESKPYLEDVVIEGKTLSVKNQKCYNYVCFRPMEVREIDLPDGSTHYVASPIIVKFKGGSLKHGKKFNQVCRDYASFKQPSWCMNFKLTAKEEKNEKGDFFVYTFEKGHPALKETQLAAAALNAMVSTARKAGTLNVIDDEDSDNGDTVDVTPRVNPAVPSPIPNMAPKGPEPVERF